MFHLCFVSINHSSVGGALINTEPILSSLDSLSSGSNVYLGAILYQYNYILANALTDGLIEYTNGKVLDVYENGSGDDDVLHWDPPG